MQKNLVIVESPAKAKTIARFLGSEYKVLSSYGHVRDLKKNTFSIDIEKDFEPEYEIPADKSSLVRELKNEAKKADVVWLASDEDREGEAIAWHLYEVLNLKPENTQRIAFHEITETAIREAIENPRKIDIHLVDAQQARRVLDRIVGFELSPVLWRKIRPALSAGRVQSVALRLVVEREREINDFKPEVSFRTYGDFILADGSTALKAELQKRFETKDEAKDFLQQCAQSEFSVLDVNKRPGKRSPAMPFTTSTLQQEAARKLGFSVSQTMRIAQKLYEEGHITYMRTDSVNLSNLALGTIKNEIIKQWGEEYYQFRRFKTKAKGAQEAHEAIRPTYIDRQTISGTAQEQKLYQLIRKRTLACQMADAQIEKTTISIGSSSLKHPFLAQGEVVLFDGFLGVYRESFDDDNKSDEADGQQLPSVSISESLALQEAKSVESFSQRPARYSEASLVRKMEELGIGRPSTYAPTINTIQNREYVLKGDKPGTKREYVELKLDAKGVVGEKLKSELYGQDKGKLLPTDTGIVVTDFLLESFPNVIDYNFTARIEKNLDQVADGQMPWNGLISKFYDDFHPIVTEVLEQRSERRVGERLLGTDPTSGLPISVRLGKYGPMVQKGSTDTDEKPTFAGLQPNQSIDTISLEEALELFKLPKKLGQYEETDVTAAVGRFGPYVRHAGKFVSIPKDKDPLSLTLDEAIELIEAKRLADEKSLLRSYEEDADMEIRQGRFGPYIKYKGKNYKIPKTIEVEPSELSYDEAMELVKAAGEKPARKTAKATKKTSSKTASKSKPKATKPASKPASQPASKAKTSTKNSSAE